MNRTLKIVFITLGILILALFASPFILKNSILNQLKIAINEQVDGTIEYESDDLSLIQTFPNLTVNIENVNFTKGRDSASIDQCKLSLNLFSVLNGKPYEITEISIFNPEITIHKPAVQTPEKPEPTHTNSKNSKEVSRSEKPINQKEKPLQFSLKRLNISNGTLLISNSEADSKLAIRGFNLESLGSVSKSTDCYSTEISATSIDLSVADFEYLKQQQLSIKSELSLDKKSKVLTVETCQIKLNQFESSISGNITQKESSYETDLTLGSDQLTLKKLISLLYAPNSEIYEQMDAQGDVALNGFIKGDIGKDVVPAFQVSLKIEDGVIPLAATQDTIKEIDLQLTIGNSASKTYYATLSPCNFCVGKNPVDVNCKLEELESQLHLSGELNTQFELADLSKIIQIDSTILVKGKLTSTLSIDTYITDFKEITTNFLKIDGKIILQKCTLNTPNLVQLISIKSATIIIDEKKILLKRTELTSGRNRLKISGESYNVLNHFLKKETLKSELLITSDLLDLNTIISNYQPDKKDKKSNSGGQIKPSEPTKNSESKAENIATEEPESQPKNRPIFELGVTLDIGQATYNSTILKNIASKITLSDQQITLSKISFNQQKGFFSGSGKLSTFNAPIKRLESKIEAKKFTVDQTLKLFPNLKTSQPFLANLAGEYTLEVNGAIELSEHFKTRASSVNTEGTLTTSKINVKDITELQKIAKKAKLKPLERVDIDPLKIEFEIKNGNLTVKPFDFKSGDISGHISGTTSVDNLLNYTIHLNVPRQAFNSEINAIANNVLGTLSQFGIKTELPKAISLDVIITGTSDNPIITTKL